MPERRVQYDPGLRPQVIRPIASPVDEFVRPAPVDKLDQLGAALSRISPEIQQFAGTVADNVDSSALNEGRLAAEKLRTEGLTLAAATREGVIKPSQNPFYLKGLKEQQGRNLADKYDSDLRAAMGQDETLQYSTNIGDFDKFTSKFRDTWTKQNIESGDEQDTHLNTGFQFRAGAYESQARASFANGIDEKVKTQGDEATHQEVVGAIQHAIRTGVKLDGDALGLNQHLNDLIAQGRNGAQLMRTTALAIHDAAVADPEHADGILKLMESVRGKSGTLSTTSYGMALADKAENAVAEKVQRQYSAIAERAKVVKQKAEDDIFARVNKAFLDAGDNAHTVDIRPFQEEMNKVSPEHVSTLAGMQDAFTNHEYKEDPHVAADLLVRLHTVSPGEQGFVTMATVANAFSHKDISKATFNELAAALSKRDTEKSIASDRLYIDGVSRVKSAFANEFGDTQENRLRADNAITEFTARYIRQFAGKTGPEFDAEKNQFIQDHIAHEFLDKGSSSERSTFNKVPQPQTGPQRPDVTKVRVVDRTTYTQMQSELTQWVEGARQGLSTPLVSILKNYGVPPTKKDIQKFIYDQKHLYEAGQPFRLENR